MLAEIQGAAVVGRVVTGPRAGAALQRLGRDPAAATVTVNSPPPRSFEDRRRLSALVAPTTGYGRRKQAKAAPPVVARAQGDGGDLRGTSMRYALHLGSFRSKARADELRSGSAKSGYRTEVESVAGTYRVTVPNLGSRDAARQAARTLSRTLHVDPVIVATR